jgi:hypothetical protein
MDVSASHAERKRRFVLLYPQRYRLEILFFHRPVELD